MTMNTRTRDAEKADDTDTESVEPGKEKQPKSEPQAEWESEGGSPPDSISQVDKDGEPPTKRD